MAARAPAGEDMPTPGPSTSLGALGSLRPRGPEGDKGQGRCQRRGLEEAVARLPEVPGGPSRHSLVGAIWSSAL